MKKTKIENALKAGRRKDNGMGRQEDPDFIGVEEGESVGQNVGIALEGLWLV